MARTQVLRVEINGLAKHYHGNHTPGIVATLRLIASKLERDGVQTSIYPFNVHATAEGAEMLATVYLDETGEDAEPILVKQSENHWRWRPSKSGIGCRTKYFGEKKDASFRYGEAINLYDSQEGRIGELGLLPESDENYSQPTENLRLLGWALANSTGRFGTPIPVLLAKDVEVLLLPVNETDEFAEGDIVRLVRWRGIDAADTYPRFAALLDIQAANVVNLQLVEKGPAGQGYWCRPLDRHTVQGQ